MTLARRGSMLWALVLFGLFGCDERAQHSRADGIAPALPITAKYQQGGSAVDVSISTSSVQVGERFAYKLVLRMPRGAHAEFPDIGDELGPFQVVDVLAVPARLDEPNGSQVVERTYSLESYLPGEQELPSIALTISEAPVGEAASEAAAVQTIETESFTIAVRSALPAGEAEAAFGSPGDPLEIPVPAEPVRWMWWAAAIVGVMIVGVLGLVAWLRRREARGGGTIAALPAHVWAKQQLEALRAKKLPEAGTREAMHEYFVRLSDIVRQYIERRFGLMAPEQTTEEFLRDAGRNRALEDRHREMLASFLRAADMVKFALHMPTRGDADAAMAAANVFVDQTTPVDVDPSQQPALGAQLEALT